MLVDAQLPRGAVRFPRDARFDDGGHRLLDPSIFLTNRVRSVSAQWIVVVPRQSRRSGNALASERTNKQDSERRSVENGELRRSTNKSLRQRENFLPEDSSSLCARREKGEDDEKLLFVSLNRCNAFQVERPRFQKPVGQYASESVHIMQIVVAHI